MRRTAGALAHLGETSREDHISDAGKSVLTYRAQHSVGSFQCDAGTIWRSQDGVRNRAEASCRGLSGGDSLTACVVVPYVGFYECMCPGCGPNAWGAGGCASVPQGGRDHGSVRTAHRDAAAAPHLVVADEAAARRGQTRGDGGEVTRAQRRQLVGPRPASPRRRHRRYGRGSSPSSGAGSQHGNRRSS